MPVRAVFLDVDGVLVDHAVLQSEYVRLLGHVLAPALGGTPDDWGRANRETFPALFARLMSEIGERTDPHKAFRREYVENVRGMCEHLGRPVPDAATCERLGRELNVFVRANGRFVFAAAEGALHELASRYSVHLATSNPSWLGRAVLSQLESGGRVGIPAGPDLVGVLKHSPAFYRRLFALAEVEAGEAVVVDDSPAQLAIARAVGARTVLVDAASDPAWDGFPAVPGVGAVPAAIRVMESD